MDARLLIASAADFVIVVAHGVVGHRWFTAQLRAAQLHRCTQALHGQRPDYVCAYAFNSREDFERFEHSDEKAAATAQTNSAAGRSSIEIVQRVQFTRVLHRRYGAQKQPVPQGLTIQLQTTGGDAVATSRWLGAALQEACAAMPLGTARVYQSLHQPHLLLFDLSLGACDAREAWETLHMLLKQPPLYGQAPAQWTIAWAASSASVMQWLR